MVSGMLRSIGGSMDTLQGKLSSSADSFQSKMGAISSSFAGIASVLGGLTIGVVAGLVSAGKAANNFDQTVFLLHAHGNLAAGDINTMSQALLNMADSTGYSADQLAKSMFYIESVQGLSLSVAQATSVQTAAAQLARIANADLGDTTKTLVQILQSGIVSNGDYATAAGQVNQVVANGVMTMDDLNAALKTGLAPTMQLLHIGIGQMGSALDALTQKGFTSSTAATALRNSLIFMTNDSKAHQQALAAIGLSYDQLAAKLNNGDLIGALQEIYNAVNKTTSDPTQQLTLLEPIFGRTRGVAGAGSLLQSLQAMPGIEQKILGGGQQLGTDFANYLDTPAGAAQRLTADVKNLWISIGEGVNQILPGLVKTLDPIINGFINWTQAHKDLIAQMGPAIVEILGLATALAGVAAAITGIMAINPVVLLVVGAIVAGAILIRDNWSKLQPLFDQIKTIFLDDVVPIAEKLANIFMTDVLPAFITIGSVVVSVLLPPLKWLLDKLNDILGWVQNHGPEVKTFFEVIAGYWVTDKIVTWGKTIVDQAGNAYTALKKIATLDVGSVFGKLNPFSGSGGGGAASDVASAAKATMQVATMEVAEMTVASMLGGGGLPSSLGNSAGSAVSQAAGQGEQLILPGMAGAGAGGLGAAAAGGGAADALAGGGVAAAAEAGGGGLLSTIGAVPIAIVALVAAAIAGLVLLFTHLQQVGQFLGWIGGKIGGFFGMIGGAIGRAASAVWGFITGVVGTVAKAIGTAFGSVVSFFEGIPGDIAGFLGSIVTAAASLGQGILNAIGNGIKNLPYFLGFALGSLVKVLINFVTTMITVGGKIIGGLWSGIKTAWNAVTTFFHNIPGWIWDAIKALPGILKTGGTAAINGFVDGVTAAWNAVTTFLHNIPGWIWDALKAAGTWLVKTGGDIIGGLKSGFTTAWNDVTTWFHNLPGNIGDFFKGAINWLWQTGQDIINGLLNGIKNAWNGVTSWIHDAPGHFLDGFKNALGISSPSKVMAQHVGAPIVDGIIMGMMSRQDAFRAAVGQFVPGGLSSGSGIPAAPSGSGLRPTDDGKVVKLLQQIAALLSAQSQAGNTQPQGVNNGSIDTTGLAAQIYALLNSVQKGRRRGLYVG